MNRFSTKIIIGLFVGFVGSVGFGQYAMEQYIPIGQSIGVSNITSIIGVVETKNSTNKQIKVNAEGVVYTVTMNSSPNGPVDFWIDNSLNSRSNQVGKFDDIAVGSTVEAHFKESTKAPNLTALWVKILGARE